MSKLLTRSRRAFAASAIVATMICGPLASVASATRYVFVDSRSGEVLVDVVVKDGNDQTRYFFI
jgi:hypothetical protein